MVSGIANGIMIEGGSFYGWDIVFIHYPPKPPHNLAPVSTTSKFQKSKSVEFLKHLEKKSLIKMENQEMQRLLENYEKREILIENQQE